jgi:hypothetical protein
MAITPLPTPPSRDQSEATFVNNANAFLGALPTFATEANALAVDVNADAAAAEAARVAAVGAANYKGEYNAGTTYQVGHSVSYLGTIYTAKTVNTGVTPASGANWVIIASEALVDYQEFTASGNWTKPAGARFVYVEAIGGGGGGGRGSIGGAGGGGGAFNAEIFRASDVGATVTVTIGAGGAGRASNTGTNPGLDGGNTTFGALVTAPGGKGGGAVTGGSPKGGDGGGGERGFDNAAGSGGYSSGAGGGGENATELSGGNSVKGGAGGAGALGSFAGTAGTSADGGNGGAAAIAGAANAGNGVAPGGGGGGKRFTTNATDGASGNGGAGRVRVWAW